MTQKKSSPLNDLAQPQSLADFQVDFKEKTKGLTQQELIHLVWNLSIAQWNRGFETRKNDRTYGEIKKEA